MLLYTSQGVTATSQFRARAQLPLRSLKVGFHWIVLRKSTFDFLLMNIWFQILSYNFWRLGIDFEKTKLFSQLEHLSISNFYNSIQEKIVFCLMYGFAVKLVLTYSGLQITAGDLFNQPFVYLRTVNISYIVCESILFEIIFKKSLWRHTWRIRRNIAYI